MNIANKTILVTGTNRGIGRALINEALKRGVKQVYAGARGDLQHTDPRVTPLKLDVTDTAQIQHVATRVNALDLLINNAGIVQYVDLSVPGVLDQHLAVNLFGMLQVTQAFTPALLRNNGAIANILSLAAIAPIPLAPAYSRSKAAASNLTQSLRALLAGQGVKVHAVFPGPIDTDMSRGLDIPKASTESTAIAIFDGIDRGDEDIFPDPVSQSIADSWRAGVAKGLEAQFAVFVPDSAKKPA